MLGIEEGIRRRKEIQEAIHPPDHKIPGLAGDLPEERALLFSKQETSPDLKKEMLKKKEKTKEHNFSKIPQKERHFGAILPEDMQFKDVHNLWQEEKLLPPCHKLCFFKER